MIRLPWTIVVGTATFDNFRSLRVAVITTSSRSFLKAELSCCARIDWQKIKQADKKKGFGDISGAKIHHCRPNYIIVLSYHQNMT